MKRVEGKGRNKRMDIQQGRKQMEKGNCYFFTSNCAIIICLFNKQ